MSNKSSTLQRLSLVATLVLATMLLLGVAWDRPAHAAEPQVREVVVKLKPDTTISRINYSYRTTTVEKLLGSAGIYRVEISPASKLDDVVAKMKNDCRL